MNKIDTAVARLKQFEPPEGYWGGFSGGKDSVCIKRLGKMAAVKIDWHYSRTTIDPPELVYFIRKHHPDVIIDKPKRPFLHEMVDRGFPMRNQRWCCADYKEAGGHGRVVLLGIRQAEGPARERRQVVETCYKDTTKRYVNPIIDWLDKDVWYFIGHYEIPYCSLYDEGFKRLGCIMCPLATPKNRLKEAIRWPGYTKQFRKAFHKLYKEKKRRGLKSVDRWADGDEMFNWWLHGPTFKSKIDDLLK